MTTYKLSVQNLSMLMSHLPAYGLDIVQISSENTNGELLLIVELNGNIPEPEIEHFNTDGQYLEVM